MVWVRRSVNLDETRKMNQGFLLNLDNARGLYLSLLKLKDYFFFGNTGRMALTGKLSL